MADLFGVSSITEITGCLSGRLIFGGGFVGCLVRDLSEGGARIEISSTCELPPMLQLEVPSTKVRVWARRAWCSGKQTGLAFFEPCAGGRMQPLGGVQATRLKKIRELRDRSVQPAEGRVRS